MLLHDRLCRGRGPKYLLEGCAALAVSALLLVILDDLGSCALGVVVERLVPHVQLWVLASVRAIVCCVLQQATHAQLPVAAYLYQLQR